MKTGLIPGGKVLNVSLYLADIWFPMVIDLHSDVFGLAWAGNQKFYDDWWSECPYWPEIRATFPAFFELEGDSSFGFVYYPNYKLPPFTIDSAVSRYQPANAAVSKDTSGASRSVSGPVDFNFGFSVQDFCSHSANALIEAETAFNFKNNGDCFRAVEAGQGGKQCPRFNPENGRFCDCDDCTRVGSHHG